MGVLSNELKNIKEHINQAKDVINTKYQEVNKQPISTLTTGELAEKIDEIPALDTSDATATPQSILEGETAYVKGKKEIGVIRNYCGSGYSQGISITGDSDATNTFTCNISSNIYIDSGTKLLLPVSELKRWGLTPDIIVKGKSFYGISGTGETGIQTGDANATSSDILKNKTAYVNGKKVTGTLQDYRNKATTTNIKLNGNTITVSLPELAVYDSTSVISISFSKIANLIGLKGDIIKKGESILGIEGDYSKPPAIPDNGKYFNIDELVNCNVSMKMGFWELASGGVLVPAHPSKNSSKMCDLYRRIYNAYYYNGDCDGYYTEDNPSVIYKPTYQHPSFERALSVYTGDLGLNLDECNEVFRKIRYDCSELIPKFSGFGYSPNNNGTVDFMFLSAFDIETLNNYRNTCLNTFNEICSIIQKTYGIPWKGGPKFFDCVNSFDMVYTTKQKVQIAKVIHDYLVLNNTYGWSSIKNLDQTMYPALSKGIQTPVCASYAHAFQWCCHKFGIFALPVMGTAGDTSGPSNGRHMWNMVCYESYNCAVTNAYTEPQSWCEVDVTWDDPSTNTTYCTWEFFNTTTSYMKSNYGGNRNRAILDTTSFGNEAYRHFVCNNCACTQHKYNGTQHYGGM